MLSVILGILSLPTSKITHSKLPCILHANRSLEQTFSPHVYLESLPPLSSYSHLLLDRKIALEGNSLLFVLTNIKPT